jgi:predicted ATPase/transcriptional regulator with XRE-family HTH domain
MDHPTFGRWLKLRRRSLGLTQAQLGQKIGYAGETIRKVEADEQRPSRQMAENLATVLEIAKEERIAFIRFARDEAIGDEVVLPVQGRSFSPPLPAQPTHASSLDLPSTKRSLPVPRDPLIGREWEVTVVQNLLLRPSVGLVTLIGPGGVGKTRLALQVAANLRDHTIPEAEPYFMAGVYFVPLAALDDPALVLPAIAQTLEVREAEGQSLLSSVQTHLHEKQLLLVLDNFEQVVSAGLLLSELLQAAPRLKLLVTSRSVLRLRGEHQFAVPPLTLPDNLHAAPPSSAPDLDRWMQFPAMRFFVERAQAAQADFAVTSQNLATISAICQQLDGLPLAIELAAAKVRLLPPQAMLTRLGSQLKLLTGGAHDLPARQQTMRATLAWSYELLSEAERCLFRRLAPFVGGCTLDAAERVCNVDGVLVMDTLDCLSSLIDKSLLQQKVDARGEPRFVLLRVVREYALERLIESGEAAAIRQQLASFFLTFVATAEQALTGNEQQVWLERLGVEYDNLRTVLEWSTTEGNEEIGLRIAGALWRFWQIRGYYHEAHRWLAGLLSKSADWTPARAKALDAAGFFVAKQGDYGSARLCHEESLAIGRQFSDQHAIARALHSLGNIAFDQGDYSAAYALFEESLLIRRTLADKPGMAASLNSLGIIAYEQGDYPRAGELYGESLLLKRELGDQQGIAASLNNLGNVAMSQGDHDAARRLHQESLALKRGVGDQQGIATSLNNLARIAIEQCDYPTARALFTESLALHDAIGNKRGAALALNNLGEVARREGNYQASCGLYKECLVIRQGLGDKQGIAECVAGLAEVARAQQQMAQAAQLLSATAALLAAIGGCLEPVERAIYDGSVLAVQSALGEENFASAWSAGRAMTLEQVIAFALALPPALMNGS